MRILCKALICLAAVLIVLCPLAFADSDLPVTSEEELQLRLRNCEDGDVIAISGDITFGSSPITSPREVEITSAIGENSTLRNLHLLNAHVSFSNIRLADSLYIEGNSNIQLLSGTHVTGADGHSGVHFSGSGTLIIDRSSHIEGGKEGAGVTIEHTDNEFYASIDGSISGGDGHNGGPGVLVNPLRANGGLMVTGTIRGGNGDVLGGQGLNLFNLSGNALATVSASIRGGSGTIGGNALQLVSASGNAIIGISGESQGGSGDSHGGSAIMLMNVTGGSSIQLSGIFTGGNSHSSKSQPGTALQMVDEATALRVHVENCSLIDGRILPRSLSSSEAGPQVTPLPEIISSSADVEQLDSAE